MAIRNAAAELLTLTVGGLLEIVCDALVRLKRTINAKKRSKARLMARS
jgi:hypothetical protein